METASKRESWERAAKHPPPAWEPDGYYFTTMFQKMLYVWGVSMTLLRRSFR